jgi:hypothetical protein
MLAITKCCKEEVRAAASAKRLSSRRGKRQPIADAAEAEAAVLLADVAEDSIADSEGIVVRGMATRTGTKTEVAEIAIARRLTAPAMTIAGATTLAKANLFAFDRISHPGMH